MAFVTADRVRDTSTSTGTGNITVSGSAPTGFRTLSTVLSVADTFYYAIQAQGASEWEVGLGTYTSANTFARTTVLSSSNAGSAVNFSAGTKDVFLTLAALKTIQQDNSGSVGTLQFAQGSASTPSVTASGDTNTGIFYPSTDTIAVSTSGVERARFDSSGNFGIGVQNPNAYGSNVNVVSSKSFVAGGASTGYGFYPYYISSTNYAAVLSDSSGSISFVAGTSSPVERVKIDSAGRVTRPYQTAFYAVGGSTQSWSGSYNVQTLQLNSPYSLGSRSTGYNSSNYRFTAPVAGAYLFFGKITNTTSNSTGPEMFFYVNSGTAYYGAINYVANSYATTSGQIIIQLAAGDYVELVVGNNNNVSFTLDLTRSNFGGFLIG